MSEDILQNVLQKYQSLSIPWTVLFELTYRCNLRCKHCYVTPVSDNNELSFQELKRIMIELEEMGTLGITFSGGEIFLRKDIFDILEFASSKFRVSILTNGTLITPQFAYRLKDLGIASFEVSLYGNRQFHDRITRVAGSFERIIKSLRCCKEADLPVILKCTAMKGNLEQYKYLKQIAQEMGARFRPALLIYPRTDGSKAPCDLRATDEKAYQKLEHWFEHLDYPANQIQNRKLNNTGICNAGRLFCSITPNGQVHPCPMLPWNLGNLRNLTFKFIWQTEPTENLNMLRNISIQDISKCSQCNLLGFCTPCIGLNFLENSEISAVSAEYCRNARWLYNRRSYGKGGGGSYEGICKAGH